MSRDVYHMISDEGYQAVYIEGELVDQGHSIDWLYVIDQLGCNTYRSEVNNEWIIDQGEFPTDINEVQFK